MLSQIWKLDSAGHYKVFATPILPDSGEGGKAAFLLPVPAEINLEPFNFLFCISDSKMH